MKCTELPSHLKRNLGVVTHETRVTLQVITVKLHVTWQHPKKKRYNAIYLEEFNSNWLKIPRYIVKDIHFRFTELFCLIWSNHERMSEMIVDLKWLLYKGQNTRTSLRTRARSRFRTSVTLRFPLWQNRSRGNTAKKFEFALRASSTFSFRTVFGFSKKGKEMTRVYLLPCKVNPSKALLTERQGKMTQPGACALSYQGLSYKIFLVQSLSTDQG